MFLISIWRNLFQTLNLGIKKMKISGPREIMRDRLKLMLLEPKELLRKKEHVSKLKHKEQKTVRVNQMVMVKTKMVIVVMVKRRKKVTVKKKKMEKVKAKVGKRKKLLKLKNQSSFLWMEILKMNLNR